MKLEGKSGDHLVQPHCPKQTQLEQVVQEDIQSGFQYLQRLEIL